MKMLIDASPIQIIRQALENTNRLMRDRRCGSHDPAACHPAKSAA